MIATIVLSIILLVIVLAIIRNLLRERKQGRNACSGCPLAGKCPAAGITKFDADRCSHTYEVK
ncbi:MAG: FeoB-associated Cys-rich membrane protein [Anaerolineaceae bacterium]